jgi:hypothetical protein
VLERVEHFHFLIVEDLLLVVDPDIFQLNVENVVKYLLNFVLSLETTDGTERGVLLLVLGRELFQHGGSAVSHSQRYIETRLFGQRMLFYDLEVAADDLFVLFEAVHFLLQKSAQIIVLSLLLVQAFELEPHLKILLLQSYVLLFEYSQFLVN